MSETNATETPPIESPPAAAMPARDPLPDPRQQLYKLANQLVRAGNRRLLIEYLRLRRTLR